MCLNVALSLSASVAIPLWMRQGLLSMHVTVTAYALSANLLQVPVHSCRSSAD